jgi:CRISPR/Cas system CMR-associated protein Cmr3 (group 5 of RAMP superfamily)
MNSSEAEQHSCTDVRYVRDNKTLTGAVCVALNKDIRERKVDIIFMGGEKDAWSVRSTTELMNILIKWKVSFEERKRVFDFVAERLRVLAAEEIRT